MEEVEVEELDPEDEIQVRNVLAVINTVVAEAGEDFKYGKKPTDASPLNICMYVWEGKADCLAARVLALLGMPLDDMAKYEGNGCDQMVHGPTSGSDRPQAPVGLYGLATLRAAQNYQDRGVAWGECRDAAHRWAKDCYGIEV
jgi:hypothetical protein